MTISYQAEAPEPETLAKLPDAVLLEFGVDWCPHCQAAEPAIAEALAGRQGITHLRIEDGRGRPLGRAFGVKLWPTLVLLRGGSEVGRAVRPVAAETVAALLDALNG